MGMRALCENHRGTSLVAAAWKVLSGFILRRTREGSLSVSNACGVEVLPGPPLTDIEYADHITLLGSYPVVMRTISNNLNNSTSRFGMRFTPARWPKHGALERVSSRLVNQRGPTRPAAPQTRVLRDSRENPSLDQGVPIRQIIPSENRLDLLFSSAGLHWSSSRLRLGTTPVSDLRQRPPRRSCESMFTFADDLKSWSSNASALQMDVDAAKQWSLDWHLPLNDEKCVHVSFGGDSANAFVMHGEKGPENLMRIDAKVDLGIWVSSNFSLHHEKSAQNAFTILRMMRRKFSRITRVDFQTLYGAYVRPLLEYANQVVYSGRTKDVTLIERVQRAATRMVAGLKSVDYETRLAMLDLFPLEYRRLRGDLILTYALFEQSLANRFFTVDPKNTRRGHSERQPLTDKNKTDPGNLGKSLDPVYQSVNP
ncbi:hypothetical protein T265_08269 [Opisthorchis viverrini]|uniref:Reverse transcriptase domain-containing protein n=1 Tax=Opisthorchis viverrini TaxID=6198 RepID=A0A074ZA24_OPIVI|nr:hypothetical protein T265_08269 [Opisthorchis viverrini]KER23973.1 hypothetical protein T265_08269 [Opisthorchis viverrini]